MTRATLKCKICSKILVVVAIICSLALVDAAFAAPGNAKRSTSALRSARLSIRRVPSSLYSSYYHRPIVQYNRRYETYKNRLKKWERAQKIHNRKVAYRREMNQKRKEAAFRRERMNLLKKMERIKQRGGGEQYPQPNINKAGNFAKRGQLASIGGSVQSIDIREQREPVNYNLFPPGVSGQNRKTQAIGRAKKATVHHASDVEVSSKYEQSNRNEEKVVVHEPAAKRSGRRTSFWGHIKNSLW